MLTLLDDRVFLKGSCLAYPIVIGWRTRESKRQDNSSPSPMADPQQSPAPLTDSLRSDILLISSYLDGKQSNPSEPHSKDDTLSLYLHISTLLAIGNESHRRAENVNAVIGETTAEAVEFLVCAENAKQHTDKVKDIKQRLRGKPPQGGKNKGMDSPTESVQIAGENKEDSAHGAERPVIPNAVHGRELLNESNDEGRVQGKKWVVHLSIEWLIYMTLSDFEFGEHLQDVFDVIDSLKEGCANDLARFQVFIHHRAYRKLGWRVLDFSTHWGKSPFAIISDCLAHPGLESKDFTINRLSPVHELIQGSIPPQPSSETNSDLVYRIDSDNALKWLEVLTALWELLRQRLIVHQPQGKAQVRKESPSVHDVVGIVFYLSGIQATMPVFQHLLSAPGVVRALAEAGKLNRSFASDCCAHVFPEISAYVSRTSNSSGDKRQAPDTDVGDGDESGEPDTDGGAGDNLDSMMNNRESCPL